MGKQTWLQCENNDRWNSSSYCLEGNDDDDDKIRANQTL